MGDPSNLVIFNPTINRALLSRPQNKVPEFSPKLLSALNPQETDTSHPERLHLNPNFFKDPKPQTSKPQTQKDPKPLNPKP